VADTEAPKYPPITPEFRDAIIAAFAGLTPKSNG